MKIYIKSMFDPSEYDEPDVPREVVDEVASMVSDVFVKNFSQDVNEILRKQFIIGPAKFSSERGYDDVVEWAIDSEGLGEEDEWCTKEVPFGKKKGMSVSSIKVLMKVDPRISKLLVKIQVELVEIPNYKGSGFKSMINEFYDKSLLKFTDYIWNQYFSY